MIQLNDIYETVINPFQILYFTIDDNPIDYEGASPPYKEVVKTEENKKKEEVIIVREIKCFLNGTGIDIQYDSVNAFESDYRKLLTAKNA